MAKENESYKTAYAAANARLMEQFEPKETRLFDDPLVKNVFSSYISSLMKINPLRKFFIFMYNISLPGLFGLQICRTKYIDDLLTNEIENGIEQLVVLGAGFDTRAYRIKGISKVKVFEVDMPIILEKKKQVVKKSLGILPKNVVFTPIDFNTQVLDEVLQDKGLDISKPIFFIWEGVTQYITEEAVNNTMKFISKASPGSIVVATYILKSVIDGTSNMIGAEGLVNLFKAGGQAWSFGLNPSETSDFLNKYKLTLIEDVGITYYNENYLEPIGRKLDVSRIERVFYGKIT